MNKTTRELGAEDGVYHWSDSTRENPEKSLPYVSGLLGGMEKTPKAGKKITETPGEEVILRK